MKKANTKTHLRAVNPTSMPVRVEVPFFRTAFASAVGTGLAVGVVETIKYIRRRSSNPDPKKVQTQQQTMLSQLAATNPAVLQSPFMQQIAAMNGMASANPMLSPTTEAPPAPQVAGDEPPPWFSSFAARLASVEKKGNSKKSRRKRKPKVVQEDEYEDDEYEEDE